jgi:hypothetical protein
LWALGEFFPSVVALDLLSTKRCEKLYEELRTRPSKRTKKPFAADTHPRADEELPRVVYFEAMASRESMRSHQGHR